MRGARRLWSGLGLLVWGLAGLPGCGWNAPPLRPPKQPDEIVVPPAEDARFSLPQEYPKNTLNGDNLIRPKDNTTGPGGPGGPGGGPRFGAGSGGGAPGGRY
jgi:hypothetical protein